MLLAELAASELSTGQLALYPLAILALAGLVKWWMSGTEKSIQSIADDVKAIASVQSLQGKDIAVLQAHREQHAAELERLRQRQLENTIGRLTRDPL